jgi:hypothetical protein
MTDPLRRLKFLPWRSLLQVTALVVVSVMILEFLLGLGLRVEGVAAGLGLLFTPPWAVITVFAMGLGVGALATWILERLDPPGYISAPTLWALILCLILGLLIKSLLPLPLLNLVRADYLQLVGVVVGVFWKGRRYWR